MKQETGRQLQASAFATREFRTDEFEHALLEADRLDRRGAWIHLALGLLWCFSLSLGRAADNIAFVALLVVALLRLPWTGPAILSRLRASRPLALATALGLLVWLSGLWSPHEWREVIQPPRWLLVPLMLLPLARSWRMLCGALVAGACLQAGWVLFEAIFVFGRIRYGDPLGLSDNPLTFLGLLATGSLFAAGFWLCRARKAAVLSLVAGIACLAALVCLANRTATLGHFVGMATLVVAAIATRAASARRVVLLVVGSALALALAGGTLTDRLLPTEAARERAIERGERPTLGDGALPEPIKGTGKAGESARKPGQNPGRKSSETAAQPDSLDARLAQYTSSRWILWRATAPAILDAPIVGHGRDGWDAVWKSTFEQLAPQRGLRALKALNTAHNAFLQAAIDQGLAGLALLVGTLCAALAAAWRSRASTRGLIALGLVSSWAAGALASSALNISAGWLPFALMVWLVSWPGEFRRERA